MKLRKGNIVTICIIGLVLSSAPSYANLNGELIGIVTDVSSGEPIAGAKIEINAFTHSYVYVGYSSDGMIGETYYPQLQGSYEIRHVQPGSYVLTAQADGYQLFSQTVEVISTESLLYDILMVPCADELMNTTKIYYRDLDGDGYGNLDHTIKTCLPVTGYVEDGTDCDDTNSSIHPEAVEICDYKDNDCDGQTDEETGDIPMAIAILQVLSGTDTENCIADTNADGRIGLEDVVYILRETGNQM